MATAAEHRERATNRLWSMFLVVFLVGLALWVFSGSGEDFAVTAFAFFMYHVLLCLVGVIFSVFPDVDQSRTVVIAGRVRPGATILRHLRWVTVLFVITLPSWTSLWPAQSFVFQFLWFYRLLNFFCGFIIAARLLSYSVLRLGHRNFLTHHPLSALVISGMSYLFAVWLVKVDGFPKLLFGAIMATAYFAWVGHIYDDYKKHRAVDYVAMAVGYAGMMAAYISIYWRVK